MQRLFELFMVALIETATWQDNTRRRKNDDPILSRWRELQRKAVACTLGAVVLVIAAATIWLATSTTVNPILVALHPVVVLLVKGAILASLLFAIGAVWYIAQIALFERWPHDLHG